MASDCAICDLLDALDYAHDELYRLQRHFKVFGVGRIAAPDEQVVKRAEEVLFKYRGHKRPHAPGALG